MKVVLFKNYSKKQEVYYNYGDDYVDVWHNLNAIEEVKDVSEEEFERLNRAVSYFNMNHPKSDYSLQLVVIAPEAEMDLLVSDLLDYEKKEGVRLENERKKREEEALEKKLKAEARKKERLVKKISKDLNLSIEEVEDMLKNKS